MTARIARVVALIVGLLGIFLFLSGCGAGYQHALDCQRAGGPDPHPAAGLFGLAGYVWEKDDPAFQTRMERIDRCMAEQQAAR